MARWPSGLRRCVQVAVLFEGVGSNPTLVIVFLFCSNLDYSKMTVSYRLLHKEFF